MRTITGPWPAVATQLITCLAVCVTVAATGKFVVVATEILVLAKKGDSAAVAAEIFAVAAGLTSVAPCCDQYQDSNGLLQGKFKDKSTTHGNSQIHMKKTWRI